MSPASASAERPPEWLRQLALRIGADETLVQGAGGNISLKMGDQMWIKASGTWMSEAGERPIFTSLDLPRAHAELERGSESFAAAQTGDSTLRPSIESALHVLMPQPLVVHVHSVNALAWLVRKDGRHAVEARMSGLAWGWVDYVRPGKPLAEAVARCLAEVPGASTLLLANHGVVIGADDETALSALIRDVEARLFAPGEGEQHTSLHALAFSDHLDALAAGVVFPDQAVFLGPRIRVVEPDAHDDLKRALEIAPHCAVVRGAGVVFGEAASRASKAMMGCLSMISARLEPGAALHYLSDAQVAELLGWEAEKFRQGTLD